MIGCSTIRMIHFFGRALRFAIELGCCSPRQPSLASTSHLPQLLDQQRVLRAIATSLSLAPKLGRYTKNPFCLIGLRKVSTRSFLRACYK